MSKCLFISQEKLCMDFFKLYIWDVWGLTTDLDYSQLNVISADSAKLHFWIIIYEELRNEYKVKHLISYASDRIGL